MDSAPAALCEKDVTLKERLSLYTINKKGSGMAMRALESVKASIWFLNLKEMQN